MRSTGPAPSRDERPRRYRPGHIQPEPRQWRHAWWQWDTGTRRSPRCRDPTMGRRPDCDKFDAGGTSARRSPAQRDLDAAFRGRGTLRPWSLTAGGGEIDLGPAPQLRPRGGPTSESLVRLAPTRPAACNGPPAADVRTRVGESHSPAVSDFTTARRFCRSRVSCKRTSPTGTFQKSSSDRHSSHRHGRAVRILTTHSSRQIRTPRAADPGERSRPQRGRSGCPRHSHFPPTRRLVVP